MKTIFTTITAILLLLLMAIFAFKAYDNAKSYQEMNQIILQKQTISDLTTKKLKKFADTISFGLYHGYDDDMKESKKSIEVQNFFKSKAVDYTIYFMVTLLGLLLLYFFTPLNQFTIIISLGALIALLTALFTPIMTIVIHKNIEHIGDVVLSMESKGVLGSIAKLFDSENFVVAIALLVFSIIFPLLKTISILFVAIFKDNYFAHSIVYFFKFIGKWSMADVFVVATFLVYLSASKGNMSRAEIGMGIYFFLAYVIVSIIASLSADKMLSKQLVI
jgi:hypothetical protein